MVDVVGLLGHVAGVQGQQVAQGLDDVLVGQDGLGRVKLGAELLVDLVAADLGEVIALRVEVQAVEESARGIDGGRLARTLAAVDLDEGVLARLGRVALDGGANDVGVAEKGDDLVVGVGDAKGAQQQRRGLTTLAVDGDDQLAALVDLELEPGSTSRDELGTVDLDAVVHLLGEVDARGADELGDDDALGAVDDEGATVGHQGEVTHEDELLLDLARLLVDEADLDQHWRLVGDVLGLALGDGVGRIAELMLAEGDLHGSGVVLDRGRLGEGLVETLGHEALEGLLLHLDEAGGFHCGRDLAKADALVLLCGAQSGVLCGRHQAFPPSYGKRRHLSQSKKIPKPSQKVNHSLDFRLDLI